MLGSSIRRGTVVATSIRRARLTTASTARLMVCRQASAPSCCSLSSVSSKMVDLNHRHRHYSDIGGNGIRGSSWPYILSSGPYRLLSVADSTIITDTTDTDTTYQGTLMRHELDYVSAASPRGTDRFRVIMDAVRRQAGMGVATTGVAEEPSSLRRSFCATGYNGDGGSGRRARAIRYRTFSSSPQSPSSSNREDTLSPSKPPTTTSTPNSLASDSKSTTKKAICQPKEKTFATKTQKVINSAISSLIALLIKTPGVISWYLTHPKEFREKLISLKDLAKKEAHHYYMGSKLLLADIRTAKQMLSTTLSGTPLTRRERKQLLRTVTDVFRVIPMSVFVLIPFMEFALPFALKLFPNMLPSTFQDSLKAEETMKRELKSRIAMAEFFQETLQDMAKEQKKTAAHRKKVIMEKHSEDSTSDLECTESREQTAVSFLEFIEKARKGEMFPPEVIIKFATYFKDDLTLDNMPRMQLINMCKYMSIPPYGNNNLLRLQLRHRIRVLQEDDQKILWEGMNSLTKMELREACQERGMRSTGLSRAAYQRSLQQWIDLSVNRNVPISLLIMSRTFFLQEEMTSRTSSDVDGNKSVSGLADAISGLDKEVVNEVILESATAEEKRSDPALLQLKLEVLEQQNDLIEEENKQREADAAERAEKEQQMILESETAIENEKEMDADIAAAATIMMEGAKQKMGSRNEIQFSDPFGEDVDAAKKTDEDAATVGDDVVAKKEPSIVSAIDILQSDKKKKEDDMDRAPSSSFTELEAIASHTMDRDGQEEEQAEEEAQLSSEEIDAISELVSPDPVSAERQKLERLKAAMSEDDAENEDEGERAALVVDDGEGEYRMAGIEDKVLPKREPSAKGSTLDNKEDQSAFVEMMHGDQIVEGTDDTATISPAEPLSSEQIDRKATDIIEEEERCAADEAEASTQISMGGELSSVDSADERPPVYSTEGELLSENRTDDKIPVAAEEEEGEEGVEEQVEDDSVYQDEKLDKAIARLKTKVESMVGDIEMQLTDVEAKIGDKLHFLDKDGDGILSREEMAVCLQKVLKRTLTLEEAMAIAADMDQNQDGLFSVEELSRWLETNKLVKLVEEGDHAEIDKIIAANAEKILAEQSDEKQDVTQNNKQH